VEPLDHALAAFDDFHLQVGNGRVGLHAPNRPLAFLTICRLADEKALRFERAAKDRSGMRVMRDQKDKLPID
jgi:hypothetical protein